MSKKQQIKATKLAAKGEIADAEADRKRRRAERLENSADDARRRSGGFLTGALRPDLPLQAAALDWAAGRQQAKADKLSVKADKYWALHDIEQPDEDAERDTA